MRKFIPTLFFSLIFLLALCLSPAKEASANQPQSQITTPAQLIDAVNGLRISYGLRPLTSHPILMQSAQSQADYMAATGQVTHSRPGGGTYTQQLLSLGFPLSGDLSLGGFRAENILFTSAPLDWNVVPSGWEDELHMNTMLSQNYTNIGAGISQGSDGYYYAVDTAAATSNGQMQETAAGILAGTTGQSEEAAGVNQYMVPVVKSTARPDGDVIHKVQYGQTLWSIAIEYGTTIRNIQALNNLGEDLVVYQGQALLVQKAATQPPPETSTPTFLAPVTQTITSTAKTSMAFPADLIPTTTITETQPVEPSTSKPVSPQILVVLLIFAAFVGAGMAVWLIRDPDK